VAPGPRRECGPDRAVHRDIHQPRHPLGGDPAKDRGRRAGSPSGRTLPWRSAAGAHPVAAVARGSLRYPHGPPGAARGPGRAALWNAPRPNRPSWAVTAAYGGRARTMPRSLLRRPAAWGGGSGFTGCDASNASGRGHRASVQATASEPHRRTTLAAHMSGSRENEHVMTMRRASAGTHWLVTHLESITQLAMMMMHRGSLGRVPGRSRSS